MNIHAAVPATPRPDLRDILGVRVAALGWDDAIARLRWLAKERRFTPVGFLNAHNANVACADPAFAAALGSFLVLPDGVGVDLASKLLSGEPFPANLNGTDFIPAFLAATPERLSVGLLGATRQNADGAAEALRLLAPQHAVEVVHDGFFDAAEERDILERLKTLRPDVLLVAMGVPRQEFWIAEKLDGRYCTLPFAVGALLDFLSGAVPRAPAWMRWLRLEWLFRLLIEPGRLWRRYIVGNPLFLARVIRQKLGARRGGPLNSRFVPEAGVRPIGQPDSAAAIVTASYAPDFERCRLLCDTMDRHVSSLSQHYILVEHGDVALFRQLEGPRRRVIDERDLLPPWLRSFRDPASLFRRRIWLSFRTRPLRGWHVQQLRRIAIAAHAGEEVLTFCDSDVAFVKPFDLRAFSRDGKVRLFRRPGALPMAGDHPVWSRNAGAALGIAAPAVSTDDYISTLISWRRETVLAMCRRIETQSGRSWVETIASERKFSECMLYGRYVDEVAGGADHFHGSEEFCRVHWTGAAMSDRDFHAFLDGMSEAQVAVGMQSFIGTDVGRVRRLLSM